MAIELWDDKSGNAIDEFETEEQALAFVRETINLHGSDAVATWALDHLDDRPLV